MSSDIHICGSCRGEFHDLDDFIHHKRSVCVNPPVIQTESPLQTFLPQLSLHPDKQSDTSLQGNTKEEKQEETAEQLIELSCTDNSNEYIVNVATNKGVMNIKAEKPNNTTSSSEQLILPAHQQLQLKQLLDAQKVDLNGIDISKVIVLSPSNQYITVDPTSNVSAGSPVGGIQLHQMSQQSQVQQAQVQQAQVQQVQAQQAQVQQAQVQQTQVQQAQVQQAQGQQAQVQQTQVQQAQVQQAQVQQSQVQQAQVQQAQVQQSQVQQAQVQQTQVQQAQVQQAQVQQVQLQQAQGQQAQGQQAQVQQALIQDAQVQEIQVRKKVQEGSIPQTQVQLGQAQQTQVQLTQVQQSPQVQQSQVQQVVHISSDLQSVSGFSQSVAQQNTTTNVQLITMDQLQKLLSTHPQIMDTPTNNVQVLTHNDLLSLATAGIGPVTSTATGTNAQCPPTQMVMSTGDSVGDAGHLRINVLSPASTEQQQEQVPALKVKKDPMLCGGLIKKYPCTHTGCNYVTAYHKDLARHMRVHTGEKPFKCDVCDKRFTRSDKLKVHKRSHSGSRPYKCNICPYTATDGSSLKKHKRTHTGERPYKCQICNYSSKNSSQLTVHLRIHTGDTPFKCKVCHTKFKIHSDLTRHMRIHSGEKPYKCQYCDYWCAIKGNLKSHIRINHNPERMRRCTECQFESSSRKASLEHFRTHNSESKNHQCPKCSYQCMAATTMKTHMLVHSDEKPYHCNYCGFASKQNGNLRTHIRHKHPTKPMPSSKRGGTASKQQHILTTTLPRRSTSLRPGCKKSFRCTQCDDEFVREDSLRSHQRWHKKSLEQESLLEEEEEEEVVSDPSMYVQDKPPIDDVAVKERELRARLLNHSILPHTSTSTAVNDEEEEEEEANVRRSRRRQAASNLLALKQNSHNLAVEENRQNEEAAAAAMAAQRLSHAEADAAHTLSASFLNTNQEHSYHMPALQQQQQQQQQQHEQNSSSLVSRRREQLCDLFPSMSSTSSIVFPQHPQQQQQPSHFSQQQQHTPTTTTDYQEPFSSSQLTEEADISSKFAQSEAGSSSSLCQQWPYQLHADAAMNIKQNHQQIQLLLDAQQKQSDGEELVSGNQEEHEGVDEEATTADQALLLHSIQGVDGSSSGVVGEQHTAP